MTYRVQLYACLAGLQLSIGIRAYIDGYYLLTGVSLLNFALMLGMSEICRRRERK